MTLIKSPNVPAKYVILENLTAVWAKSMDGKGVIAGPDLNGMIQNIATYETAEQARKALEFALEEMVENGSTVITLKKGEYLGPKKYHHDTGKKYKGHGAT